VVRNAIILVDFIEQRLREGVPLEQRLKPCAHQTAAVAAAAV
jgi:multidrug efflux pump subunit AcrB